MFLKLPFSHKIQGLFVGKILIGGPDNTYTSLNAGYNYLEGKLLLCNTNYQAEINRFCYNRLHKEC